MPLMAGAVLRVVMAGRAKALTQHLGVQNQAAGMVGCGGKGQWQDWAQAARGRRRR
jgi:hypothetical protein